MAFIATINSKVNLLVPAVCTHVIKLCQCSANCNDRRIHRIHALFSEISVKVAFHFHIFNSAWFTVKESVIDLKIAHRIN